MLPASGAGPTWQSSMEMQQKTIYLFVCLLCVCVCTCAHMDVKHQRSALRVFLNCSLPYFLRLSRSWPICLDWLATAPQESSCLHFLVLGLKAHTTVVGFSVWFQGIWTHWLNHLTRTIKTFCGPPYPQLKYTGEKKKAKSVFEMVYFLVGRKM